jgi:hypothetical protein
MTGFSFGVTFTNVADIALWVSFKDFVNVEVSPVGLELALE